MASQNSAKLARQAEMIYEQRLKAVLETSRPDEFVAIEPVSGDYFLGRTLSEAMAAARKAHPDRLAHALRVGHSSALHFGASLE
ncbi:MAG: hypothetical protein HYS13_14615 [Planctomycetia bacterium]|nr:hypothetical protein [Planctomycetia bacterium]